MGENYKLTGGDGNKGWRDVPNMSAKYEKIKYDLH